jgi:hypothetical protein
MNNATTYTCPATGTASLFAGRSYLLTGTVTLTGNVVFDLATESVPIKGSIIELSSTAVLTLGGYTVTFMGTVLTDEVVGGSFTAYAIYDSDPANWEVVSHASMVDSFLQTDMIAAEAVSLAKMSDIAVGNIITGQASERPGALDISAGGTFVQGDGTNAVALVNSISGNLIVGDGTKSASVAVSGDATLSSAGVVTLASSAFTGKTAITSTQSTDTVLVSDTSDSGNLKEVALGNLSGTTRLDFTSTAASTPSSTDVTVLATYTMPANTMGTDGDVLYLKAYGTTGATANTKTLELFIGATAQSQNSVTTTPNAKNWICEAWCIRTGASLQKGWVKWTFDGVAAEVDVFSDTEDFTAAMQIIIKGTNGTATSGEITFNGWTIMKEG